VQRTGAGEKVGGAVFHDPIGEVVPFVQGVEAVIRSSSTVARTAVACVPQERTIISRELNAMFLLKRLKLDLLCRSVQPELMGV
jgi:hypothetical protein